MRSVEIYLRGTEQGKEWEPGFGGGAGKYPTQVPLSEEGRMGASQPQYSPDPWQEVTRRPGEKYQGSDRS